MASTLLQAERQAKITTPFGGEDAAVLTQFTAIERLSEPFTIIVDVIITEGETTLHEHLGAVIKIEVAAGLARSRIFHGRLWEIAQLKTDAAGVHYRLILKPWASFLDINIDSRIFQEMSVDEVAKQVFNHRGVGSKLNPKVTALMKMEYCVQWQESDFDFVSRLFERFGVYYYYQHSGSDHIMVATDQKSIHMPVEGIRAPIEVRPFEPGISRPGGAIWNFTRRYEVAPVMATVSDYDFVVPAKALKGEKETATATSYGKNLVGELYVHPGGFTNTTVGNRAQQMSERLVEAARVDSERCTAEGDSFAASVGSTIEISPEPGGAAVKYLIVATTHVYVGSTYRSGDAEDDELTVQMELIPATVQYRPALKTARPRIYGPQTAIVTGTAGEEIETEKHGRIKVHFHWDRVQKADSNSSCWIRVSQSTAGAKWGAFVLPRIGQEVVVEFLNGDPDAPLVTGSVYNGINEVPYPLPANKTRSTFKSRSSPNSVGFNELRIEDKAGSEEVFFNAEKDLNSIVDKGNETRTLNKGNRTTTITKGNEVLDIKTGNRTDTLGTGNDVLSIKKGNRTTTIDVGDDSLTIKTGNQTVKINMGKQSTEAMQSIELKVGASTIKIEPAKITLDSVNIEIKGSVAVKIAGVLVNSEASGINTVKGALVKIN